MTPTTQPTAEAARSRQASATPLRGRPLGQVAVAAVLAAALAGALDAGGLAPAWAVLLGVAAGLSAPTPAAVRGVALVAGGLVGWAAGGLGAVIGDDLWLTSAVVVGGVVLVAALAARLAPANAPLWTAVLGAAAVLVPAEMGAPASTGEVLAVLAGLAAGVVAVLVTETASVWRRRPETNGEAVAVPTDDRRGDDPEPAEPGTAGDVDHLEDER